MTGLLVNVGRFEYEDRRYPLSGKSFCRLDVYLPVDWKHRIPCGLVLFTDPGGNSGVSITNASETIAQKVWDQILAQPFAMDGLDPAMLLWVERYPRTMGRDYETYDQISYSYDGSGLGIRFRSPNWRGISPSKLTEHFKVRLSEKGLALR